MAFVPVPKDLNRVKTKVMFNLTKQQLICFAVAAVIGVPVYFLTKPSLGITTAAMLMVVLMLPCIFFALYEKDGQPAEKVLDHMIKAMFLRDRCTCREQQGKKADNRHRRYSPSARFCRPRSLPRSGCAADNPFRSDPSWKRAHHCESAR